jgi:endonuclease/exonuclease/phosphatase family metal-dependent hydrolase
MTTERLSFATWNIGGAILGESHQINGVPDLRYVASVISERSPGVVCLQETHEFVDGRPGQAAELAEMCGYPYFASRSVSDSHLVEGAFLGLSILSRAPIEKLAFRFAPNPALSAVGPNGKLWRLHDKGHLVARMITEAGRVSVINGHFFPLHHFGASASDPSFSSVWRALSQDLLRLDADGVPVVGLFDLNYGSVEDVLGEVLTAEAFSAAFEPGDMTELRSPGDQVLFNARARLLDRTVVPTLSDHAYCEVELAIG